MSRNRIYGAVLALVLCLAAIPAFAGSAIIGSVAGTMGATVGGQPLVPNSVVFSGDSLKVTDGATVIALNHGGRLVFGRETEASLLRDDSGVTVLLGQGNVSLYQADLNSSVRVKIGDISVSPVKGFKTLGEVAMVGNGIVITAKEGSLRVEGKGTPVELAKGKSIVINKTPAGAPQAGAMQKLAGGNTALEAGALGAGVVAAILAGIALKRAGDAKDNAAAATAAANSATSAANAATSEATAADSDAVAAGAAAAAAQSTANAAGCAANVNYETQVNGYVAGVPTVVSPYTPPTGMTCPTFIPAM